MKTGFVCSSGYNMVASATRSGRQLIAVVLGTFSQGDRAVAAATALLDGFARQGGYDLIVSDALYVAPGLDVTSQVLQGLQGGSAAPKAPAKP